MDKTKIEVDDEEIELLRQHAEEKRKRLIAELSKVDTRLSTLGKPSQPKAQTKLVFENIFSEDSTIADKGLFALRELNKFSTSTEVFSHLIKYLPAFPSKEKKRQYASAVYTALKNRSEKTNADLIKSQNKGGTITFGFNEWLDANGKPKFEFL